MWVYVLVFASLCSKNDTLIAGILRALTSLTILCPSPFLHFLFLLLYPNILYHDEWRKKNKKK